MQLQCGVIQLPLTHVCPLHPQSVGQVEQFSVVLHVLSPQYAQEPQSAGLFEQFSPYAASHNPFPNVNFFNAFVPDCVFILNLVAAGFVVSTRSIP
jgi:hypothetical protein